MSDNCGDKCEELASVEKTMSAAVEKMSGKLDEIITHLSEGNTKFATIMLRLRNLEAIVYTGLGFVLLGVLGGILALVIKSQG